MDMKTYRFGVLGAGSMGKTIAAGAVRAGLFRPDEVLLFNRSEEKRAANRAEGYAVTGDFTEVYTACDTVLLSVKPQNFAEVLPQLAACKCDKPLVLSIAAGISFAKIEAALGADTPIIRAMPNTPLMLGVGATQLVRNAAASEKQLAAVRSLFDEMGVTTVFDKEDMINEAIPYAGSAPGLYLRLCGRDGAEREKARHRRTGCASDVLPDHDRRGEDAHAGRKDPGGADPRSLLARRHDARRHARCSRSATCTAWSRRPAISAPRAPTSSANKNFRFFEKTG